MLRCECVFKQAEVLRHSIPRAVVSLGVLKEQALKCSCAHQMNTRCKQFSKIAFPLVLVVDLSWK